MPGRNVVKPFVQDAYYHAYNRGVDRQVIFNGNEDYRFFVSLFARHLQHSESKDQKGRPYPHLRPVIDLLAFCLMPNHFHLLVYQKADENALASLMRSIGTAYTMYFNKKYRRRGPLFENHYRAVLIRSDSYLQHISRYIHLNHKDYKRWPHSSYPAFLHPSNAPEWLDTERVLALFDSDKQYLVFVDDYQDAQRALEEIKRELKNY
jgi:putative transposase